MTFKDFKFKRDLARAVSQAGFKEPSPIQAEAIPVVLEGKDVVGQAHTGTGKTAAFALPILQNMKGDGSVEAVIIVPTRELATQVADEVYKFSRLLEVRTATVYGGTSYGRQIAHIKNAGVVVATPGRFLDLLTKKKIDIHPDVVVLDEADEMLNMGFLEDIRRIFTYFEDRKQTLMFSATMPEEIKDLANTILTEPQFIKTEADEAVTKNSIKQYYYVVDEHERDDAITRLIDFADPKKSIVFCRTKRETERLAEYLKGQGYNAESLHGDVEQRDRERIMKAFRKNQYEILVATDVAARGIDVRGVSHVFNYHIPLESESYVHRIGRTGRAKREGVAMMLVTPHEIRELQRIQKDVGSELTLETIPDKNLNPQNKILTLAQMIDEQTVPKGSAPLLKKVSGGFSAEIVAQKLLAIVESQLLSGSTIGKTKQEVEKMINDMTSLEAKSEKKTHRSRKPSKRTQGRKRSIKRGTGRGEVPEPSVKSVGSSRIVARKLY